MPSSAKMFDGSENFLGGMMNTRADTVSTTYGLQCVDAGFATTIVGLLIFIPCYMLVVVLTFTGSRKRVFGLRYSMATTPCAEVVRVSVLYFTINTRVV